MTLTYFNDINVYFHMRNHYKMLKQVKSVIDTSVPQSLLKSPLAMQSYQKRLKGTTNEHLRKIYNSPEYMPKRGGVVRKHSCLNSEAKSEASLRVGSLPSRPTTRRNPIVTPKETLPTRSWSVGPTKSEKMFKFRQKKRPSVSSNRSSNTENENSNLPTDSQNENTKGPNESTPASTNRSQTNKNSNNESPEQSPTAMDHAFMKESSEEHEYLLFLLRITEDIIVNDIYSNNDIKQVFKFHIEANKDRLNMRKMKFHIKNLCKELNIDSKEYQTTEQEDEVDPPAKFQNSPSPRSCYLNSEAFLNCHDCSVIRTCSLYKMTSPFVGNVQVNDSLDVPLMENGDSSISPSLLKLLEKLSLGRVTECTEPAASTSTIMISPSYLIPDSFGKEDSKNCNNNMGKSPADFDTFVKELNSKEENLKSHDNSDKSSLLKKEIIALESPSKEIGMSLIKDNPLKNTDSQETPDNDKILQGNSLYVPKVFNEDSKSEIDISDKDLKSISFSEKYEYESEFDISSNSILKYDRSERSDEEIGKRDEKPDEKKADTISDKVVALNVTSLNKMKAEGDGVNNNDDSIVLVEDKESPLKNKSPRIISSVNLVGFGDKDPAFPEPLLNINKSSESKTDTSYQTLEKIASKLDTEADRLNDEDTKALDNKISQNQTNRSEKSSATSIFASFIPLQAVEDNQTINKETVPLETSQATKITSRKSSKLSNHQSDTKRSSEPSENENEETILKVFVQGSLNDNDYIMIKGPVYIYKPLLESAAKLVVFGNDDHRKSRRNSLNSQHSNRTFTVDNNHLQEQSVDANQQVEHDNIDEAIQFDTSLHSIVNDSMDNILELTRKAFGQFTDSKLLMSDYDLTPQKDSDNKYHHLMLDASTSVSRVNIKESLLLGDDYLVTSNENRERLKEQQYFNDTTKKVDQKSTDDIDSYLKFDSKFYDNNYVINNKRKLGGSVSMPKLTVNHSTTSNESSSDRMYESSAGRGDCNEYTSGKLLKKCSSDLMNFDLPSLSQDSSLRSEGEAYQNFERLRSGMLWNSYYNN